MLKASARKLPEFACEVTVNARPRSGFGDDQFDRHEVVNMKGVLF